MRRPRATAPTPGLLTQAPAKFAMPGLRNARVAGEGREGLGVIRLSLITTKLVKLAGKAVRGSACRPASAIEAVDRWVKPDDG